MFMPMTGAVGLALADTSCRLQDRLSRARQAFSTRRVELGLAHRLIRDDYQPRPGDVVLAEVTSLGQHGRIENLAGRRGTLYRGDEIVVAYGNRYAPDQFEAYVPADLGPCHLVAGGGVASTMTVRHARMKLPTEIRPIGILADRTGRAINLADFALDTVKGGARSPLRIAVLGSSMNAGKTTTAAGIIHGLTRAGLKVGAAKLTGTGSGGDLWSMVDAGAIRAIDFTDAGHASTFGLDRPEAIDCARRLLGSFAADEADVLVLEIADGLLQRETAMLLEAAATEAWFDRIVFAAGDAMSASFGVDLLRRYNLPVQGISGLITTSPLASREAEIQTGLACFNLRELSDPVEVTKLLLADARAVAA